MIILDRSQMQRQTISNLITAGVIRQDEAERCHRIVSSLGLDDLAQMFVESRDLRNACTKLDTHYNIGVIGKN